MIKILLFAHLQEAIGESELRAELAGQTVEQIKASLETQYPGVSLQQVMAAVNEEFATDETIVNDGDTLAFIPPISGG